MSSDKQPLVSVVIPTYNRVHTLPVSINSVLNQTYGKLELIIMDDGSEDGTEEYIKSIDDNRIRYKRNETNMGPSAARNRGAELAAGEYLAFQDSDDEWMPDKLEKQMKLMLENEEVSLVYSEFGIYKEGKVVLYVPSRGIPYEEKSGDIFSYLLLYPLIGTPTILIKTKEFLEEGGFNEALKAYEDFEFTLRFAREHKIGFVGEALLKVNSSPDSVNKGFAERIRTQFFMVREMLEPLRERDLLWEKLGIILCESETRICHDIFIEEMEFLTRNLLSDDEHSNAMLFIDKIKKSKEIFLLGISIQESLPKLKVSILKVYTELYESRTLWSAEQHKIIQTVMDMMCDCEKVFDISEETKTRRIQIQERLEESGLQWTDQLYVLADIVEVLERVERDIGSPPPL